MSVDIVSIFYYSLRVVIAVLSLIGNSTTIVAVIRFHCLRKMSNMFVANLAVWDVMAGFVALPFSVIVEFTKPKSLESWWFRLCITKEYITLLGLSGNLSGICLIAIERFVFVQYPLRYYSIVTKARVALVLVLSTVYVVFLSIIGISFRKEFTNETDCDMANYQITAIRYGYLPVNMIVFTAITVITYVRISYIAYKISKQISQQQPACSLQPSQHSSQMKFTKMMNLVLGMYFAFYLPYIILSPVISTNKQPVVHVVYQLTLILWFSNSWTNPFIYGWKNRDFRNAYKIMFSEIICGVKMKVNTSSVEYTEHTSNIG